MITFNVVKEQFGWAVRTADSMTTPFWSRALAIREAHSLAASIRRHGQLAHVCVEAAGAVEPAQPGEFSQPIPTPRLQAGLWSKTSVGAALSGSTPQG